MRKQILYLARRAFISLMVLPCFYGSATAQNVTHSVYSVYFAPDKYVLTDESNHVLESIIKQVTAATDYTLDISANTDADGSNAYNDVLSLNRAKSVETYLLSKGMVVNKCHAKALGEREPLYDNTTEKGKAGNRRVDITATVFTFDNINQVMQAVNARAEQVYTIDNRKDNVITGAHGTLINIPSHAFIMPDGKPATGNVEITLKEALNTNDIFFAGLSTTSDNQLLETGGMVRVGASVNGQPLLLNRDKNLTVSIPAKKRADSMQLFYAEKTPGGQLNWKPTGQKPREMELTINLEQLKKIKLPPYIKPEMPVLANIPRMPHYPAPPVKPYMPKEPDVIKYHANFFERVLCGRAYIQRKEDKLNKPYMDAYDARMERYYAGIEKYKCNQAYYRAVVLPQYYADSVNYINSLTQAAKVINTYLKDYATYVANKQFCRTVNAYLKAKITPATHFTLPMQDWLSNYVDSRAVVIKYLGRESIAGAVFKEDMGYVYSDYNGIPILLKDGSVIGTGYSAVIYDKIYKLANETGLLKDISDYDRQILEASAKAGTLRDNDVDHYIYTVSKLDWINCDRFRNNPNPVAVKIDEPEDAKVMVVCNDINSYMQANKEEGYYQTANLPANTAITIVAVKVKDGRLQMAVKKAVAGEQNEYSLQYNNCTLAQLKEQLKGV